MLVRPVKVDPGSRSVPFARPRYCPRRDQPVRRAWSSYPVKYPLPDSVRSHAPTQRAYLCTRVRPIRSKKTPPYFYPEDNLVNNEGATAVPDPSHFMEQQLAVIAGLKSGPDLISQLPRAIGIGQVQM